MLLFFWKREQKNDDGLELNFSVYDHTVVDSGKRDQLLSTEENKYNISGVVNNLILLFPFLKLLYLFYLVF